MQSILTALMLLAVWLMGAPPPISMDTVPPQPASADRLPIERMEELVAGPIAKARRGDLAGGSAELEKVLATQDATTQADMIESFGVLPYSEGDLDNNESLKRESLVWLARAVTAYRDARGKDDPEVAMALVSEADVLRAGNRDDPPPKVEANYAEAHRINLLRYGPADPVTAAALVSLSKVRGLPSRTRGEAARVDAALALTEAARADMAGSVDPRADGVAFSATHSAVGINLAADRAGAALFLVEALLERERMGSFPPEQCFALMELVSDSVETLHRTGHAIEEARLKKAARLGSPDRVCADEPLIPSGVSR